MEPRVNAQKISPSAYQAMLGLGIGREMGGRP